MKQLCYLLLIGAWLTGGVWAETNAVVTIKLKDGTQLEGTLLEENEQEVVVLVSHAGGTITQTKTFQREEIAEIAPLSPEELERRAMQQAYENTRRYTLHPSLSYTEAYYMQVIDNVLRPFLEKYPNSPNAETVAQQMAQWRAEWKQVTAGKMKYRGQWLPAAEARQIIEREQGDKLLAQAKMLLQRKQYERAIATVQVLSSAEAQQLMADAYQQWANALDAERQNLVSQISQLQATVNSGGTAAAPDKPVTPRQMAQRLNKPRDSSSDWTGSSQKDLLAQNRANAERQAAARQLTQAQSRLVVVERDLTRANNGARRYGAAVQAGSPAGAGAKSKDLIQDPQAPIQRDSSDNPEVLHQIAEFFTKYWMPVALVLLLVGWYFSRKMAN